MPTKTAVKEERLNIEESTEKFHRLMLKKIKREVRSGQSILHISNKQNAISDLLKDNNLYTKISSLDPAELEAKQVFKTHKAFTYVVLDLDMPCTDDIEKILNQLAPMIIRPGLLILIGTNLCSFKNKLNIWFNNFPSSLSRPSRAVSPNQLRAIALEQGFFLKNRYYQYDDLLLMFLDIPQHF